MRYRCQETLRYPGCASFGHQQTDLLASAVCGLDCFAQKRKGLADMQDLKLMWIGNACMQNECTSEAQIKEVLGLQQAVCALCRRLGALLAASVRAHANF